MTLSWSHLYSQLVPANEKENFTIPHYWPFVKGIPHKGPVMGKVFTSYGAIMVSGPQLVQGNNKEDITFTKDIHCSFNHELFSVEWRIFACSWWMIVIIGSDHVHVIVDQPTSSNQKISLTAAPCWQHAPTKKSQIRWNNTYHSWP